MTTSNSKSPTHMTHTVYVVKDGKSDQSFWREIGSAWSDNGGKGFDVMLDALPTTGRVVLRVNEPKAKVRA